MEIVRIRWTTERIEHIARHNITPEEVKGSAFDDPDSMVQVLKRADRDPKQKIYRLLGRTGEGRYLILIFIYEGQGVVYPVTARDMTLTERRFYLERASR